MTVSILKKLNRELIDLVEAILPSTVTLSAYSEDLSDSSSGSGWIYSDEIIITNFHVIDGMVDPITVKPVGSAALIGKVIGSDPDNDIAVLRVDGLKGQPIPLETEPSRLGELCVAIGSPHGLRESASMGIISGLSRQSKSPGGGIIEEMLQTDASVNPGNSGGPLINIQGQLVGMNTMGPAETVNLAVSAETIAFIVPELIAHGKIARASLGISVAARVSSLPAEHDHIEITRVKNKDCDALKKGDILKTINGKPIKRRIDVVRSLGREAIDQQISVEIVRDGSVLTVLVEAKAK